MRTYKHRNVRRVVLAPPYKCLILRKKKGKKLEPKMYNNLDEFYLNNMEVVFPFLYNKTQKMDLRGVDISQKAGLIILNVPIRKYPKGIECDVFLYKETGMTNIYCETPSPIFKVGRRRHG